MDKAEYKRMCWVKGGVWDSSSKECRFVEETPKQILDRVWRVYNKKACKNPKPDIELRMQHPTGRYWYSNKITIRPDSWNKMHPAERRLIVIHETLHACGIPHKEGFRTSQDYASPMVYEHVYGDDFIIEDFKDRIEEGLKKYLKEEK